MVRVLSFMVALVMVHSSVIAQKEAACADLEQHKAYWKGRVDLDPAKLTRLQLVCDPCAALIEHDEYWREHGGIDRDPLKRELLKSNCNPCKALEEHDAYWKPRGIDLDPGKRIILNEMCHPGSIERSAGKVVDDAVLFGDALIKPFKQASLDVLHVLSTPLRDQIKRDFYKREADPYKDVIAVVRTGNDPVSPEERIARTQRFVTVKKAQEAFLGMELAEDEVLDISLLLSGGGVRASLYGLGSLVGASKIGLLDCVMTITALSGGTWVVFPWVASGLPIQEYRERLLSKWEKGYPKPSADEIQYMVNDAILVPYAFEKDVTLTDLYGSLLSHVLFSEHGVSRQRVRLSSLAGRTQFPIPVGEAAWAGLADEGRDEELFEFSPYEVGSRWLKAYVPAWGFGRHYFNGVSINNSPENTIPLGVFGSAYAVRLSVIADTIIDKVPEFMRAPFMKLMNTKVGEIHIGFAIVPNFTRGMASSPIKNEVDIPLADSGAGKNLEIMPLPGAYRGLPEHPYPDLVVAFDSGANSPFQDIPILERMARKMNLAMPRLTGTGVGSTFDEVVTVFADRTQSGALDITKPVFMYYPRMSNPILLNRLKGTADEAYYTELLKNFNIQACLESGDCSTFSFNWPRERAEKVVAQAEFNVIATAEIIKQNMRALIEAKRSKALLSATISI